MNKKLEINGKIFEVIKKKNKPVYCLDRCAGEDLFSYYKNPSPYKMDIYNSWLQFAKENGMRSFGVTGANCFKFSLQFENDDYVFHITKEKNIAYKK